MLIDDYGMHNQILLKPNIDYILDNFCIIKHFIKSLFLSKNVLIHNQNNHK